MPKLIKRCHDSECADRVDTDKYHVRIGDNVFCSGDCASAWLAQAQRFEEAAARFHRPMHSRERPWWER